MIKQCLTSLVLLTTAAAAQADVYGLIGNRTARISAEPPTTAEAGLAIEGDVNTLAAQINHKIDPRTLVYGTLAMADLDGDTGPGFGLGAIHQLNQPFFAGVDMAVKASYHRAEADGGGGVDVSGSDLGIDLIINPQDQSQFAGVEVYGSIGLHRLKAEAERNGVSVSNSSSEIALGAGLVRPYSLGRLYMGIEIVDELFFGIGYRVAIGR